MVFPENATVFNHATPQATIDAARERGEAFVVLPRPSWQTKSAGQPKTAE